jgi:hypothetical protein
MEEKLDNLSSETPIKGGQNICEYVAIGCIGSKDTKISKNVCNVSRGKDCQYKTFRVSDLAGVGVL